MYFLFSYSCARIKTSKGKPQNRYKLKKREGVIYEEAVEDAGRVLSDVCQVNRYILLSLCDPSVTQSMARSVEALAGLILSPSGFQVRLAVSAVMPAQFSVFLVCHRLQPLAGGVLAGDLPLKRHPLPQP